jgi:hypothetical protein
MAIPAITKTLRTQHVRNKACSFRYKKEEEFNDQKEERVGTVTSSLDKWSVPNARRLGGSHSRSGRCGAEKKNFVPAGNRTTNSTVRRRDDSGGYQRP